MVPILWMTYEFYYYTVLFMLCFPMHATFKTNIRYQSLVDLHSPMKEV